MTNRIVCRSPLATRPILYTDTLSGDQVCRDDLWAVTTEELNRMQDVAEENELLARWADNERGYRNEQKAPNEEPCDRAEAGKR